MIPLTQDGLALLPSTIKRPAYDRTMLRPGIVHIGLGNFHRAHQAWYVHRLMQQGLAKDWAIIGAGVRPNDAKMREKLAKQDYLTTLIELDPSGTSAEIVGSIVGYVPVQDGHHALISQMAAPEIRIVSLTITEGGYYIDPATGLFDDTHIDIKHDAANPESPITAFGAIVASLKRRRREGSGPFTLQSCDNLQGNGSILRQTVVSLARLSDPDLSEWIDAECCFPNSMVDCIVPATGDREHALVQALGINDLATVTHENFRQWVIEDEFCNGRPDWDLVGATFSDNVCGYEAQKIRILNAGHQLIANASELLGIVTVAEAMSHEPLHAFFRKVALDEIAPLVDPVPDMTPEAYVDLIDNRFANPAIFDTIRRVAFDGSSRHPGFVLPSVRDALARGTKLEGLAMAEALWARMCLGQRENGSTIKPNDPIWDYLTEHAKTAAKTPRAWLEMRDLYGDLADQNRFVAAFEAAYLTIRKGGVEGALNTYLKGT